MKKMGLFGGTFDPIHESHVSMALRLCDALGLDGVILMPTYVPPHKLKTSMADAADRLMMCRLACADHPRLTVSDMEIQRGGASFTADTLEELSRRYPDTQWYLFTGADMFMTLRTWYRYADIIRLAVLCAVPREGVTVAMLREYAAQMKQDGATCYVDDRPEQPVSSTEVRRRLVEGERLDGLLSPSVEAYIRQRGLYIDAPMTQRTPDEQYKAIIRNRLSDYRYHHSLCVAQEAARLARRYGADADKAYTAGILHDIMKDTDKNAQLQILSDFAILLDEVEKASPTLYHARAGEVFLRHILQIQDEDLLTAVRYHTTGRAGMSLLEKVLFVADFTSADRDYDDVEEMRRLADISLEDAMVYGIAYTIEDLVRRRRPVHPDTVAAYNALTTREAFV